MLDPSKKYNVAVIGSGISGLASAWFLSQQHQVTLFEKNPKLGGHTNTIEVEVKGEKSAVDTGFIVYNEPNYPYLKALLAHLEVATHPTDMSFAVSIDKGKLEYAGNNLNTLFAQRRNLLSPKHWRMIFDILRFNKMGKADLQQGLSPDLSLGEYLEINGFGEAMQRDYLLPMAAAIWSCPTETMLGFPVNSFLQFFENHGLLNVNERPQWQTIVNGSQTYIDRILDKGTFKIHYSSVTDVFLPPVESEGIELISADGQRHHFDQVVFACHGDESYELLKPYGFELLKNFRYQFNQAWLHTDINQMPKRKSAWASWNYLSGEGVDAERAVAVSYWMNQLQPLNLSTDVFVTLNPITEPAADKVIQKIDYMHPVFDRAAIQAQTQLHKLQGKQNCWFAGAYTGYGFHEDGLTSAVNIARKWQVALPWER
ncbi:FAD-dependent oxidoreductase [Thiomicrospira microaerophila]|uniref:NAD(P)/FAD-dependent oxidoreductase n=1 Tax=Thiomicrospira microaerophila TaxID=406020 RepID=UPI00200E1EFF|nr:FAD-dependent oxidoreductase [Thiomicrospira microaerophila]UQB42561.1 FAD-dependent oxidoreductase [Thiomicrospira microaerophila]